METSKERDDINKKIESIECQQSDSKGNSEEVEEKEESRNEVTELSESVFIYPNRKMSDHGNVFEGEIRSGVYGVRVCAIKIDRKSGPIVTETKILTKISPHTHVISIIQSGIYEDSFEERVFIALDKCHKQNLHQHITHQKESGLEFNLNEALEYSKQIVAGVKYVHENLIIHKDLKPSNILLTQDKSTIKLADFGLSQEIKSTSSKVYSKHQFGTNGFRPIESFGNNWVSLKSDVFSLGVVIYFVLSNGKSPFGDEISLWTYNTQNGVVDIRHLLVPNAILFQHLIQLMLSKERCRRPSIWQVADHPCWTGRLHFDYGFTEEVDDSVDKIQTSRDSSDFASEKERRRQLLRDLEEMGFDGSSDPAFSIIIFDENSKHLQRFNLKNRSLKWMHEFKEQMKDGCGFSSVSLGDHTYVLTAFNMYRLTHGDVATRWEQLEHVNRDHGNKPPAIAAFGAIYVVGGSVGRYRSSVSKYDPSTNRWNKLNDKQLKTKHSAIVASREHVYCIGGRDKEFNAINRVERMDVLSETWDDVAPMRQARYKASAVEFNGTIIASGGRNIVNQPLNTVEKYEPYANQWTIMKPMTKARYNFQCHAIEGNVYAVGGDDKAETTIEKYDIERDEWKFFHDLGTKTIIWSSVVVKFKK